MFIMTRIEARLLFSRCPFWFVFFCARHGRMVRRRCWHKEQRANVHSLQYEMLSRCAAAHDWQSTAFFVAKRRSTVRRTSVVADVRTTGRAYTRHVDPSNWIPYLLYEPATQPTHYDLALFSGSRAGRHAVICNCNYRSTRTVQTSVKANAASIWSPDPDNFKI